FPARLTQLLWHRFQKGRPPLILLPCELFERNGHKLRALVVGQAQAWGLPDAFQTWISRACTWPNSLVDRIVTTPTGEHSLIGRDPLLIQAEPYALWAIEQPSPGWRPPLTNPAVEVVEDLTPYYL